MDRFDLLVIGFAFSDALCALGTMLAIAARRSGAAPRVLTLPAVVAAVVVTTGFCLLKLILLRAAGLRLFAFITLIYVDLAVVIPLLGIVILLLTRMPGRWQPSGAVRALAILALLGAPIGAYATFVEPFRLQRESVDIVLPAGRAPEPVRIAVLADLQFDRVTAYEHRAVSMALDAQPDLIVLPGDFFQGTNEAFHRQLPEIQTLLARLHAPGGVYAVQGNMESVDRLQRIVDGTGVTPLVNELAWATVGTSRVLLGGVELYAENGSGADVVHRMQAASTSADVAILLAHRPDAALITDDWKGIDLVIAGHTHGGQIQLPFFGPPFTATNIPRHAAAGGLHDVNGARLYISRGVGSERGHCARMRVLCPPEVSILTLRAP